MTILKQILIKGCYLKKLKLWVGIGYETDTENFRRKCGGLGSSLDLSQAEQNKNNAESQAS